MHYDGLILDFGEVLSYPQQEKDVAAMADVLHVDEARFRDAYWHSRREYDLGLPAAEYWTRTLAALGMAPPDERQLDALIALDVASWTSYRDDMWTLAEEFRARGGKTGFLSNGVAEIMARIRTDRPLDRWFDAVVVSCELGVVKPGPEIFQICLERMGTPPDRTLFVDDRRENTDGAAALGIVTLTFSRHHRAADVRAVLGV
jgi:putative hydrolase of the HAD superfamily